MCRLRVLGFESLPRATRCFVIWYWRGSSNRPARSTRSGCLPEIGVSRPRMPRSSGACRVMPNPAGGKHCLRRAQRMRGLGPASLVFFDVSTLYFETDAGDGFREPGFSKERRLEPQITLGLLTDAAGFPLTVEAFEGNKAETATMLPVINAFKAAHQLTDVTVVADAGMISEANQVALQAAGLSFILGRPYPVSARRGARVARQTPR